MDDTIGIAVLIASIFKKQKDKYLIVASNLYKAQQIYNLLYQFLGNDDVLLYPVDELLRAESIAQSKEMVAQRLYVLDKIIKGEANIIVTNVAGVSRYLPPKELFEKSTLNFEVGKTYDLSEIKRNLIEHGYTSVNKIDASLQFAVRGDILDIFSVNNDNPIRIEFFGDEIESIRFFDIVKQTSISKVDKVTILPGNDIIFTKEEVLNAPNIINELLEKDAKHLPTSVVEKLKINVANDIDKIIEGNYDQRVYKYFSLISSNPVSLFSYLEDYTKVMVSITQIEQSIKLLLEESWNYLNELFENGKTISHLSMYQDITKLVKRGDKNTIWTNELIMSGIDTQFDVKPVPFQSSKSRDALDIIHTYLNSGYKIVIAVDSKERIYLLQESLTNANITYENKKGLEISSKCNVAITLFSLSAGFVVESEKIVVLTSKELFNVTIRSARFNDKFKEATILKSYEELEEGDYVVHEFNGIGQFLGIVTTEVDGVHRDFMKIAYAGGDYSLIPLSQFQLVRKFVGREGQVPRLSRLNGKDWENTKRKIKERVSDLANRLVNLYTERSKIKGIAFQPDDEFQREFESNFPYELTFDQARSLKEIKEDMESERPMDRLLCGDVGFGKTELAFRAAFKAILSGKQVAILCPTTLLARQHYELALPRFSPFDVKIAILSRLISPKETERYIEGINDGSIHLAIGTHKLLSKKINFKDLGLLIIDEEQRFGVEQKERIKELRTNVDVLTLSATPIPRTLQISLLGVRQLSQINTPPQERMPIQTYVMPFNIEVVKELIERELGRSGQVFFMHNEVLDIYEFANRIQKLVPFANVGVAHGQMPKNDIEDVMMKFYNGEINVLVCTSIVENGIDVPNANMIIVQDSERYGLAQLYQIKGRVGRSNRIAYAYLMYPEHKMLTEATQKRLKALQEFTELGSGYRIAQRDLMIRGAGDILGPEQAGFIDNIGLDMYIKLLNEAVRERMNMPIEKEEIDLGSNLTVDGYIPDSYANESDKVEIYQEINSAQTHEQLIVVKQKTIDIFGKLPKEVELLFRKRDLDILSKEARVKSMSESFGKIEIILDNAFNSIRGIGNMLFETIIPFISYTKIVYRNKEFVITMSKRRTWMKDLESLLSSIASIYKLHEVREEKL